MDSILISFILLMSIPIFIISKNNISLVIEKYCREHFNVSGITCSILSLLLLFIIISCLVKFNILLMG